MAKKEPLVVGQNVWLETTSTIYGNAEKQKLQKMIVLEANKTSAYIWREEDRASTLKVRYKVDQKTYRTKYSIPDGRSYRLWLSEEEYNAHLEHSRNKFDVRNFVEQFIWSPNRTHSELDAIKEFIHSLDAKEI